MKSFPRASGLPLWLLFSVGLSLAAASPKCPEDGSNSYFTGNTRTSSAGYQMHEYKCYSYGHLFWVRA
jgi:hypothetical protein